MELSTETQQEVIKAAILHWEKQKYTYEVMAKAWRHAGNHEAEKKEVDGIGTVIKLIDHLTQQLEGLK